MDLNNLSPLDAILAKEDLKPDRGSDWTSILCSLIAHLLILLVLSFWVLPAFSTAKQILEVSVGDADTFAIESVDLSLDAPTPDSNPNETPLEQVSLYNVEDLDLTLSDLGPQDSAMDSEVVQDDLAIGTGSGSLDSLATSASVESAVDRITAELHAKLQKGDLMVVWMLDSSNSLVDDRKRVATRLIPFYEDLFAERSAKSFQLRSAVVSFGSKMRERVPPTEFGEKIISAVEDLPVDRSGSERIFDAVKKCATHYRQIARDKQVVLVIWTDESGDDGRYLEDAIQVCRENEVSVSVVGPSSVLGADTGLHSYRDPKSGNVYQLPVKRGPDSARPERLELGYWYMTRSRGGRRGQLPSWMGGQDLEGVLSGFSPYALTRLTMQTGGSYTIFDRPEDRGPFDFDTMRNYAPSYDSQQDYLAEIKAHPLRAAIMKAVGMIEGKKVDAPDTMLFIKSTGPRHFDFMRFYYPPAEFQAKLRSSKGRLIAKATRYSRLIESALEHLSEDDNVEVGLEDLYRYEKSPRWKAWYDLTRGRLLANSVRLEEYRLTLQAMTQPGALAAGTNHAILVASPNSKSKGEYRDRAEEAERLLRRCAEVNRGTPWETLAQRELDFALGVGVREMTLRLESGGPAPKQPNLPRF